MSELVEALRRMAPFEALDKEQLEWLAASGTVEHVDAGRRLFDPGPDEYEALWILLDGEIVVSRVVGSRELEGARADHPGAWAGAVPGAGETSYGVTARAARPSQMFRIPRSAVDEMMRRGFPVARHFLSGLTRGTRNMEAIVRQHEKLESLGKLAAGLAHEINNPAAAARRTSADLRRLLQVLAGSPPTASGEPEAVADIAHEARALKPPGDLTPLERSDREEEVADWLARHGAPDPWELGPQLMDAGVDAQWLDEVAGRVPEGALPATLAWLATTLAAERLLNDLDESLGHITELVQSMKSYSYLDRTPIQQVDLRKSIGDTLTILKHKLAGITVEQDFPDGLPLIEAYGSDLNQVWTNLLDNAADVLQGSGHISITARREGDDVIVQITDDGPGIPPEIQSQIFDAFFTTKDVGHGLGLGLEITHRTVVQRHKGDIRVESRPGRTCFSVRLPIRLPEPDREAIEDGPGTGPPPTEVAPEPELGTE